MNVQGAAAAYAPQQIPPPNPAFYSQNKGTLSPGQVIQIQSLTVTVDRFLSQGGFAHVYLVRTATPVNGTTQHVLKRMLVADHMMLQDVKKEVDIMRILKGHPNIVNLIDSAWNRLQDGRFEVFILMEFCAGGGIIDMMNRRLRERLTEGEILQIFVDVCEGLALMHSLQPALLHRDLKVENILQANETSYKLCDFGSSTAVSKPPTTTAEMPSILREHGTQRPTVFDLLDSVHRIRGTRSRFQYAPRPQPSSPGLPRSPEDIVSFRSPAQVEPKPSTSSAAQARQAVLDAVAPMRRGRPNLGGGMAVVPPMNGVYGSDDLDLPTPRGGHFKSVTTSEKWTSPAREAPAALGGSNRPNPQSRLGQEWMQQQQQQQQQQQVRATKEEPKAHKSPWDGLGSLDSTEKSAMNGFGDAFNPVPFSAKPNQQPSAVKSPPASTPPSSGPSVQPFQQSTTYQGSNAPVPTTSSRFTMPTPSRLLQAPRVPVQTKPKDSLGEMGAPSTSAPTTSMMMRPPSNASTHNGLVSAFSRPSTAADSVASNGTGFSSAAVVEGSVALSAADRFPTIEQLELGGREKPHPALFRPRSPLGPRAPSPAKATFASLSRPPAYAGLSRMSYTGGLALDHDVISPPPPVPLSGVRSQQVTGTAMKGSVPAAPPPQPPVPAGSAKATSMGLPAVSHTPATPTRFPPVERPPSRFPTAERPIAPNRKPLVSRRRGNTMELKVENGPRENQQQQPEHDLLGPGPPPGSQPLVTQRTPSPSAVPQKDWLMDDDIVLQPMIKASTGSMQPRLPTPDATYVDPNKAKRATLGTALISFGKGPIAGIKNPLMESTVAGWQRGMPNMSSAYQAPMAPPPTSFNSTAGVALPGLARRVSQEGQPMRRRARNSDSSPKQQHQPRQGSVHGLVDMWSGAAKPTTSQKDHEELNQLHQQRFNHQRDPSKDLMKFPETSEPSPTTSQNSYTRAMHLFPPLDPVGGRRSPSSASGSEKDTDAPRPPVPQKRFSGSKGRPSQLSFDRMRPQSLFVSAGGPTSAPGQQGYLRHSPPDSLSVPSPTTTSSGPIHRQRSPRRGSISDMVSRYEALSIVSSTTSGYTASTESGPASPKFKPVVSTKPASLHSDLPNSLISPTRNAPVFPPIDPSIIQKDPVKMNAPVKMRTSPLLFKALESPTETRHSYGSAVKEQEPHLVSQGIPQKLNPPVSDRGRSVSPGSQTGTVSDMNEDILVSPRPRVSHQALEHQTEPSLARARTPPTGSPSPEIVYKGVGKLIDQWQKKTEEAEGKGRKPTGPRQLQRKDLPPGKPTPAS
ncbi:hypothetical protein M408DRAFT_326890 [Serendipita vermifera MAFF 305830]|uniref:non-specific serine/threonine protein kinase n=1 Tax=Serendipita vermifera MAFF 305830 TaxID=933852 RepID=A0A0C2X1Z0_SERVB|nr:hypothetical protein M408DRAFT_326890 [Serendipita vermifera MAFF 305830]